MQKVVKAFEKLVHFCEYFSKKLEVNPKQIVFVEWE